MKEWIDRNYRAIMLLSMVIEVSGIVFLCVIAVLEYKFLMRLVP